MCCLASEKEALLWQGQLLTASPHARAFIQLEPESSGSGFGLFQSLPRLFWHEGYQGSGNEIGLRVEVFRSVHAHL